MGEKQAITVNSEIFARVLFFAKLRLCAYAKFREKNHPEMAKSLCRLLI